MPIFLGVAYEAIVAFLVNAFRVLMANQLGRWIVQALLFMGITYGVQKVAVTPTTDFISNLMNGRPGGIFATQVIAWLGVLRMDTAVSMLVSTIVVKRGLQNAKFALYASRIPVGIPR